MFIAVEGCCHGKLDKIYETMQNLEKRDNIKIELLLCCGDFQAVRDEADLSSMAVPDKYKSMESFWEYYNGKKKAPYLTIFIGGNHEASNHLQELPYGGWVAPNIFYMGYANVIVYKGVRIGGISGIFKYHDYNKGHFEYPPYDDGTKRSVYHVRNLEVFRLKLLKNPVDIMMSHDWPNGIVHYGNVPELLRRKPFFEQDIQRNRLGSPPLMELLHHMKPKHWFSGHLHVKFNATVMHQNPTPGDMTSPTATNFLALDKCLPRRQYLQVIRIETPENNGDGQICFDPEWLAVLKSTNELLSISRKFVYLPKSHDPLFQKYEVSSEKVDRIKALFPEGLKVPENFKRDITPLYDPTRHNRSKAVQCKTSHQTTELCSRLELNDPLLMVISAEEGNLSLSLNSSSMLFDEDDEMPSTIVSTASINEDEIDLGSDDDDDANGGNHEEVIVNKTDAEVSISVLSEKDSAPSQKENNLAAKPDILTASSLSSEEDLSDNKASSGSDTNRGIMRLSLSLPAPVFGATSTPVRQQNSSPKTELDGVDFIPLSNEDLSNPSTPQAKTQPSLAKNALLLSLKGKRLSDTDSEMSESGSNSAPSIPRKFKRRNASFYTSQSEEDTS